LSNLLGLSSNAKQLSIAV